MPSLRPLKADVCEVDTGHIAEKLEDRIVSTDRGTRAFLYGPLALANAYFAVLAGIPLISLVRAGVAPTPLLGEGKFNIDLGRVGDVIWWTILATVFTVLLLLVLGHGSSAGKWFRRAATRSADAELSPPLDQERGMSTCLLGVEAVVLGWAVGLKWAVVPALLVAAATMVRWSLNERDPERSGGRGWRRS